MYFCGPEKKRALFVFSNPLWQASKETYIYTVKVVKSAHSDTKHFVDVSRFAKWMLL
jgi:hypothetical protein